MIGRERNDQRWINRGDHIWSGLHPGFLQQRFRPVIASHIVDDVFVFWTLTDRSLYWIVNTVNSRKEPSSSEQIFKNGKSFYCYPFFYSVHRSSHSCTSAVFFLIGSHMEACNTRWSSLNKLVFFFFSVTYAVPAYDLIPAQGNVHHLSTLRNDAFNSFQCDLENIRRYLSDLRVNNNLRSCSISSRRTITPPIEPMIHPSYSSVYNDHLVAPRNPWVTYRPIVLTGIKMNTILTIPTNDG